MLDKEISSLIFIIMSDEQEQHNANVATPPCLPATRQAQRCNEIKFMPQHKQRDTIQFLLSSWNGNQRR